jgi:hypothetical protein
LKLKSQLPRPMSAMRPVSEPAGSAPQASLKPLAALTGGTMTLSSGAPCATTAVAAVAGGGISGGRCMLGLYARWNPIIGDTSNSDPKLSAEVNGFGSMLRSSEPDLHRLAAKRIYQGRIHDAGILALLESRAEAAAKSATAEKKSIDVTNWLLKALAATGDTKYRPIIEAAATGSPDRKVQKSAQRHLKSYYP